MESTIPVFQQQRSTPVYFYDYGFKQYFAAHPLLAKCFMLDRRHQIDTERLDAVSLNLISSDPEDAEYYLKKYAFLKKKGFFAQREKDTNKYDAELDTNMIQSLMEDIHHIVFEVTDSCNLRCEYCGYGELYYDHDERRNVKLPFSSVKTLMEYLYPFLSQSESALFISFYGGEPLLNMPLIRQSVDYIKQLLPSRDIKFAMTTNAVLLDKYIEYLVDNDFHLLISFDGDERGHSYRVFHNGTNSFETVFKNVKLVQNSYPDFFDKNVSFNAVMHNRNSIASTDAFMMSNFGKNPRFSPLDDAGIKPEKMEKFRKMYNNVVEELFANSPSKEVLSTRFINDPLVFRAALFIKEKLAYTRYDSYEDLFVKVKSVFPGGTCLPFQKKLFLTVNNKLLPCERIDQQYMLGAIEDGQVKLSFESIADTYNGFYRAIRKQCKSCYRADFCSQCFFQIDNFKEHPVCYAFVNEVEFSQQLSSNIDFIEDNPLLPKRIINEVVLR